VNPDLPLVRVPQLGATPFLGMGIRNGFRVKYEGGAADGPRRGAGDTAARPRLLFIERRPVAGLSVSGMGREWGSGPLVGFGLDSACSSWSIATLARGNLLERRPLATDRRIRHLPHELRQQRPPVWTSPRDRRTSETRRS
jgi:hypothetical protein